MATASYATAVAIKDEDWHDHEDDARDEESKKVYMTERRELLLKRVERSLKRAEMKRKRPPARDSPDATQHKRPLLMSDLPDKGDPSQIDNFEPISQSKVGAAEPALRLETYPPFGTESSNYAPPSMAASGCDNPEALPRMHTTRLSTKVLPEDLSGGCIDQHSLASSFDATSEASHGLYMTSSSTEALPGHYMAVSDQQFSAGSRLDLAGDPFADVETMTLLMQELPDVHARFNYGWEDGYL